MRHMLNNIWLYVSSAITFVALFLYAMLQRNKRKQAEDRVENREKAQEISRNVDKSVERQRKEARDNEEEVRNDVSKRRASLNNNRLRNTK